ncbi:SLC5 family protein [Alterisphingorhabdus coralli]|uniref:SLC5 family protein n=1 Tax=Alterisphingorhabdus coralli TaxID=3071408 RepID=A0AA97F650_9SPHN|nr:SLC5 family protein [Parasphingorhabdus sp. SCSIO 66989]WOE75054.1 SLC5 family protein [Parasphingorhabdus sp. SCSIO 66989]
MTVFSAGNSGSIVQLTIFAGIMLLLAGITWWHVRGHHAGIDGDSKEVFLAGGGLNWFFVAGAITLTNLSTDQLVGMNGNQMLLLAWWEMAGFAGLLILAFVFVPIYYRNHCTTVTELLERRYQQRNVRTVISAMFLFGNLLIYMPAVIYSGALFLRSLFGLDEGALIPIAAALAVVGGAYAILGGLRGVAVLDTYSGIGILGMALVVVYLALQAVGFDLSTGVPAHRLTLIGDNDSPIPFHTLFTGMVFIQIFYWSTNQNITQKALAAPTVREAQKGVMVAAIIRLAIVPAIVVIPGVVAFKLFGDVNDAAYGMVVAEVLPPWTSGIFAAMIAAAVLTTFSAVLNATSTLYAVDFHKVFINPDAKAGRLNWMMGIAATALAIALVPIYANAESIINLLQELNGLFSMPILSVFAVGLLFRNVDARAAITGLLWGLGIYALHTFWFYTPQPYWGDETLYRMLGFDWLHYIDVMVFVLFSSIVVALTVNRLIFGNRATLFWQSEDGMKGAATA